MEFRTEGETGIVRLGRELRDYECSARLGTVREALIRQDRPREVILDMAATQWVDPLPLLALGTLLSTSRGSGTRVVVDLGAPRGNDHRVFLKFLAQQGFIEAYGEFAAYRWGEDVVPAGWEKNLASELSKFHLPTNYRNADYILANFIAIDDLSDDPEHAKLHKRVEDLVNEAKKRLIDKNYGVEIP